MRKNLSNSRLGTQRLSSIPAAHDNEVRAGNQSRRLRGVEGERRRRTAQVAVAMEEENHRVRRQRSGPVQERRGLSGFRHNSHVPMDDRLIPITNPSCSGFRGESRCCNRVIQAIAPYSSRLSPTRETRSICGSNGRYASRPLVRNSGCQMERCKSQQK